MEEPLLERLDERSLLEFEKLPEVAADSRLIVEAQEALQSGLPPLQLDLLAERNRLQNRRYRHSIARAFRIGLRIQL